MSDDNNEAHFKWENMTGNFIHLGNIELALTELANKDLTNFGCMNTHLYRIKLFDIARRKSISAETLVRMMILSGITSNKDRVISGLETLQDYAPASEVIAALRSFRQYVGEAANAGEFPFCNMPSTFPQLSLLGSIAAHNPLTIIPEAYLTGSLKGKLPEFMSRTFIGQLNLEAACQDMHENWAEWFWTKKVTSSRNPVQAKFKQGFHKEFYDNAKSDKYRLIIFPGMNEEDFPFPYTFRTMVRYAKQIFAATHSRAGFHTKFDDDENGMGPTSGGFWDDDAEARKAMPMNPDNIFGPPEGHSAAAAAGPGAFASYENDPTDKKAKGKYKPLTAFLGLSMEEAAQRGVIPIAKRALANTFSGVATSFTDVDKSMPWATAKPIDVVTWFYTETASPYNALYTEMAYKEWGKFMATSKTRFPMWVEPQVWRDADAEMRGKLERDRAKVALMSTAARTVAMEDLRDEEAKEKEAKAKATYNRAIVTDILEALERLGDKQPSAYSSLYAASLKLINIARKAQNLAEAVAPKVGRINFASVIDALRYTGYTKPISGDALSKLMADSTLSRTAASTPKLGEFVLVIQADCLRLGTLAEKFSYESDMTKPAAAAATKPAAPAKPSTVAPTTGITSAGLAEALKSVITAPGPQTTPAAKSPATTGPVVPQLSPEDAAAATMNMASSTPGTVLEGSIFDKFAMTMATDSTQQLAMNLGNARHARNVIEDIIQTAKDDKWAAAEIKDALMTALKDIKCSDQAAAELGRGVHTDVQALLAFEELNDAIGIIIGNLKTRHSQSFDNDLKVIAYDTVHRELDAVTGAQLETDAEYEARVTAEFKKLKAAAMTTKRKSSAPLSGAPVLETVVEETASAIRSAGEKTPPPEVKVTSPDTSTKAPESTSTSAAPEATAGATLSPGKTQAGALTPVSLMVSLTDQLAQAKSLKDKDAIAEKLEAAKAAAGMQEPEPVTPVASYAPTPANISKFSERQISATQSKKLTEALQKVAAGKKETLKFPSDEDLGPSDFYERMFHIGMEEERSVGIIKSNNTEKFYSVHCVKQNSAFKHIHAILQFCVSYKKTLPSNYKSTGSFSLLLQREVKPTSYTAWCNTLIHFINDYEQKATKVLGGKSTPDAVISSTKADMTLREYLSVCRAWVEVVEDPENTTPAQSAIQFWEISKSR